MPIPKLACDQSACVARQERRLLPWSDSEESELRPDVSYALLYFLSAQASFEVYRLSVNALEVDWLASVCACFTMTSARPPPTRRADLKRLDVLIDAFFVDTHLLGVRWG